MERPCVTKWFRLRVACAIGVLAGLAFELSGQRSWPVILLQAVLIWASSGLTDIHHQGHSPGKDVQNGDYGTEEAPSSSVVHPGVQG